MTVEGGEPNVHVPGAPAVVESPVGVPALGIPVVWNEDCLLHQPGGEVWLGLREDGTEVPERATVILRSLTDAGAPVLPAAAHDAAALLAVHDQALVEHLATIWADWEAGGYAGGLRPRPGRAVRLPDGCHARRACPVVSPRPPMRRPACTATTP